MDRRMTLFPAAAGEPTRRDLLAQVAALQGRLASLAAIEQAKGALMVTYGITADAAFDLLRFHSQHRNVKIRVIAAQLTTLLSTSPTSTEAITRFDRLLDDVPRNPQIPARPTGPADARPDRGPRSAASEWPHGRRGELPADALPAVAIPPPGITIAGNAPDLPLMYANDAFTDLTGYPVGDVLGRNCRFLQGPGTDPRAISTLSRALHTGRDVSVVLRNYRSDGSPFLNQVSISPIRNQYNQITHYLGTQIDVTHRGNPDIQRHPKAGQDRATTPGMTASPAPEPQRKPDRAALSRNAPDQTIRNADDVTSPLLAS
jgi:PAS domain S-box-containing protein